MADLTRTPDRARRGSLFPRGLFLRGVCSGALIAALCVACAAPPPAVSVTHGMGLVRAESESEARRFGQLVGDLQPAVIDALPGSVERDTEIWIQKRLRHRRGRVAPDNVKGFTLIGEDNGRGRIHLRSNTEHPDWFLAHELVHALIGPEWSTLPGALEEGLCDVIAAELAPDAAASIRSLRAVEASLFFGRMRIVIEYDSVETPDGDRELEVDFHYENGDAGVELRELLTYDTLSLKDRWKRLPDSFYGVGFLIVERIHQRHGLERLHDMCVRAADEGHAVIPYDWLVEAAGLTDEEQLPITPAELIGAEEFEAWRELVPGFHADLVVQLFRERFGHLDADGLLDRVDPRLVLADGDRIYLADQPRLADELALRWAPRPRFGRYSAATR